MKYRTTIREGEKFWECFLCHECYPNTLLFCPNCNIARKHSHNLWVSARKKEMKKLNRREKINIDLKKKRKHGKNRGKQLKQ